MLTSLEKYVEQHGVFGTISILTNLARTEPNFNKREFFLNCKNVLSTNSGGKILEADNRFLKNTMSKMKLAS